MKKLFSLTFTACFLHVALAFSATGTWKTNEASGAKTRLLGSFYQDQNGEQKLIAGLEFKLPSGWKIYAPGSESIGMPPAFDFSGSQNYFKHEISWPKSEPHEEKIGSEVFKYYTYHDEIILPIVVELKSKDSPSELTLKLEYGLCKDVCIPVSESFALKIDTTPDHESLRLIQKFYSEKITTESENPAPISVEQKNPDMTSSLLYWAFIAIVGGAILNIMPCVLPVLSIKLLSIIEHLDAKISRIRFAFFSTFCGIISCFFILAILATLIKIAGNAFGWGLQFQNPYFLIFLVFVLVLFIANLLGIFEFTFDQFTVNFLNRKITDSEGKKNIFIPNFLSGVLAVLLATPCSAPVLGSAISFALTKNISDIFLIFCSIGIGFALPYIILFIAPKVIYLLPKPGEWMLKIKKAMALLLATTALWIIYILSHNIGVVQALVVAILSALTLLCFEIKAQFAKYLTLVAITAAAFAMPNHAEKSVPDTTETSYGAWMEFDEIIIHQLVMQGKVVVVDVTADWCITCKVNKLTVLHNKEIVEKLDGKNIVGLRADITKPNEEVMKFLRKHNRFAIPFNAVYGPHAKTGMLTSELLTKKELLELIEKAK